jgi:hypothetical protein
METIWFWLFGAAVGLYLLYRVLLRRVIDNDYQRELNDILTKEEYKVKGRFD